VARLLHEDWMDLVAEEGMAVPVAAAPGPAEGEGEGEPPCPACGTAAPLVDGACSDCGLHLA
jgi:hypothetical protein